MSLAPLLARPEGAGLCLLHLEDRIKTMQEPPGMNAETVREFLRREPFEPFVIRMSNGESHEVRHPECAIVAANRVVVYNPQNDRFVYCALVHINAIEALQTT